MTRSSSDTPSTRRQGRWGSVPVRWSAVGALMWWRLPFGESAEPWPPMDPGVRDRYPELSERFEVLDRVLLGAFVQHDRAALVSQRTHRRFQLVLIVGVALTSLFGALQAASEDAPWVGVVLTALGLAASAVANQQRRVGALSRYLRERAKAEELRSLYYWFLSGTDGRSERELEKAVALISYPSDDDGELGS